MLTFAEVLAWASRWGCATCGLPRFIYTPGLGKEMVPSGYKIVFSSALQKCRAREGSNSKVRDLADGAQRWMKGWERGTSTGCVQMSRDGRGKLRWGTRARCTRRGE